MRFAGRGRQLLARYPHRIAEEMELGEVVLGGMKLKFKVGRIIESPFAFVTPRREFRDLLGEPRTFIGQVPARALVHRLRRHSAVCRLVLRQLRLRPPSFLL
jgi:hypothetical protein